VSFIKAAHEHRLQEERDRDRDQRLSPFQRKMTETAESETIVGAAS
jgi:hypothetical protein